MNRNLLKLLVVICVLLIVILIKVAAHLTGIKETDETSVMTRTTQISEITSFKEDEIDYNHVTFEQAKYLLDVYYLHFLHQLIYHLM